MLLSKILKSYILIGILLYAILFIYWRDSISFFNTINVFVFASYAFTLSFCLNKDESFYTNRNLIAITFLYSITFVILYMQLSDYYIGNTFIFSESDARYYERYSFIMKDLSFSDALEYISRYWGYDDWGAPMFMALMLKIVPSKLFVNFCYVMMNTIGAVCLFSIGKSIMSKQYAFFGTLAYSLSSYTMFFVSSYLKEEIMVFFVIVSMYMLYRYWERRNLLYLVSGGWISLLIIFFRPPVAIFVWVAYATLLLMGNKSNTIRVFFIILALSVIAIAANMIQYSADRYANGGEIITSYMFTTTSMFQKLTLYAGALIGPFPQMIQYSTELTYKSLYGAGLLFKFLLFFPFWKGLAYAVKSKSYEVYPLFIFALLEIIGLSIALDGLELRKALPHVPLFILAAFWFVDKYDEDADDTVQQTPYYVWTRRELYVCIGVVFIATLVWNTIKSGGPINP